MPYNLLLLPLLGGFLFLHQVKALNFRAQRLDGNRLLLESAAYGAALLFVARLIVVLAGLTAFGEWCGRVWWTYAPFPYSDSAAVAILIALVLPVFINLAFPADKAKAWAIRRSGDELTVLLTAASISKAPVSVTLTNLKWYVGLVLSVPNLKPQDPYVRLLLVLSGYRDRETLNTHAEVSYTDVLKMRPDVQPSVVIPVSDIKTATEFDFDVYADFFARPVGGPAGGTEA